jgi:hypothetical protein
MKKLLLLVIVSTFVFAAMSGSLFINETKTFEIRMPDGWIQDMQNTRKEVALMRGDGISQISVDIIPIQAKESNAQSVAKNQVIAYDGWQYVAGRELAWNERHGADTGFSVMYTKNILSRYNPATKIIAQEMYFVKNRQVYVVTLLTDSEHWNEVKAALLFAFDSFKIY